MEQWIDSLQKARAEDYFGALYDPRSARIFNPKFKKPLILILYNQDIHLYDKCEPTGFRYPILRVDYLHRDHREPPPNPSVRSRVTDIIIVNFQHFNEKFDPFAYFMKPEWWPSLRTIQYEVSTVLKMPITENQREVLVQSKSFWFTVMRRLWVPGSLLLYASKDDSKLNFLCKWAPGDIVTYTLTNGRLPVNGVIVHEGDDLILRSSGHYSNTYRRTAYFASPLGALDKIIEFPDNHLNLDICRTPDSIKPPFRPLWKRIFLMHGCDARDLAYAIADTHAEIYHICVPLWELKNEVYNDMKKIDL